MVTETLALLVVALLFGGMVLYSFGFAAFLFSVLPPADAGPVLRRAFPHFYSFVLVTAAIAAAMLFSRDETSAFMLAFIVITTLPARQLLMPAINRATDSGASRRFKWLHGVSVALTLVHIMLAAVVLARFIDI